MRSTVSKSRLVRLGAALALITTATTLAACGGGGGSSGSSTIKTGQPISQLLSAANKEGQVVWYTSFTQDDINAIDGAFAKQYPGIKIKSLRLNAQQVPSRMITEQRGGKYNADVVTTNAEYLNQLRLVGALQPYDPPDMQPLPSNLSLPKGFQGVVYLQTTVAAYNPQALKKAGLSAPTSFADFAKPEWKGNFSIDPEALNWYQSLITTMGHDKALALVKAIGNNSPKLVTNHTLAVTQLEAGEPAATATAYAHKVLEEQKKNPAALTFYNENPVPTDLTLTDLGKNAPHSAAAQLFDDWLLSKTGQTAIVDITAKVSLRTDVRNEAAVWNPAKWRPAYANPLTPADEYNKELAEFNAAMHVGS
jgi:iron(III) transport system substrate-binding protein